MKIPINFKEEKVSKLLLKLSVPAFFGIVINLLYGFVDGMIIGNGVGQDALGGVTVIFPLTIIMISFASLVGEGLASLVARMLGQERKSDALDVIRTGQSMTSIFSMCLIALSILFLTEFLTFIGATDSTLVYAKTYYLTLLPGLPFMGLSLVYFHQLNAQGEIKSVMKVLMISSIMNILLDYVGVYVLELGVMGAGIATSISQFYWFMHMHIHSLKSKDILTVYLPLSSKIKFKYVKSIILIGMSSFIRQIGVSISLIMINNIASGYGDSIYIASFGATQRIFRLMIAPIAAISTAFKPIVGQNYGLKEIKRIKETVRISMISSLVLGASLLLIIYFIRNQLGMLFGIKTSQITVFNKVLLLTTCMFPLYGIHHITVSYFTALGKAKEAIGLNIVKQVIFLIPLIILLPKILGVFGIFLALPISDLLSIGVAYVLLKGNLANIERELDQKSIIS